MNDDTNATPALHIRRAREADLLPLSALCMRSKAVWGYDQAFMEAAEAELTYSLDDLRETSVALASLGGDIVATAQVEATDGVADLLKLFVEPDALRSGLGRAMFDWAADEARRLGARCMTIEADPFAAAFYERMGAVRIGVAPSGAVPGRKLPLLRFDLGGGA